MEAEAVFFLLVALPASAGLELQLVISIYGTKEHTELFVELSIFCIICCILAP